MATFQRNISHIVGCNMLRPFGHLVVTCYDMLGVAGLNLKMVKFFRQHLWMLHDVVVIWPGSCNNLGHAHQFYFQYPTCRNTLQQGGQTRATCCAQHCCDLFRGVQMLRSFGWSLHANAGPTMLHFWDMLRCGVAIAVWPGLTSFHTISCSSTWK